MQKMNKIVYKTKSDTLITVGIKSIRRQSLIFDNLNAMIDILYFLTNNEKVKRTKYVQ